jgi:bifunctional non-homologous end joining protein LigD
VLLTPAEYYDAIAPVLLPYVRNRPFTMKRHYTSPRSPFVWVKDAPTELPDWFKVCPQPAKSRGGAPVRYPVVDSRRALRWMVEYGSFELHVWLSRCDRPDRPDQLLLDLDPKGGSFADVVHAAHRVREVLHAAGLESIVHTTGGDGLHVRVPVARVHTFEETRRFAYAVGDVAGVDRVNVDAKMNGHGQQLVSVYSLRTPDLTVATPLAWDELVDELDPRSFTPDAVVARVERNGDLAAPLRRIRQRLPV